MKKVIQYFIILLMLSSALSSCNGNTKKSDAQNGENKETQTEINKEDESNDWKILFYKNEWNELTDEALVSKVFEGTFSNSATTNSKLSVIVSIDSLQVRFRLVEYDSHLVKNEEITKVSYKTQNGKTSWIICWNDEDGYTGILHASEVGNESIQREVRELRNLVTTNEEIKFNITTHEGRNQYFFVLNTKGLKETLIKANLPLSK